MHCELYAEAFGFHIGAMPFQSSDFWGTKDTAPHATGDALFGTTTMWLILKPIISCSFRMGTMSDFIYHGARTMTWTIFLVKNVNLHPMNMPPYSKYRRALLSLMEVIFLELQRRTAPFRWDPSVRDGHLATFCPMLFKSNCEPSGIGHIFGSVFLIALKWCYLTHGFSAIEDSIDAKFPGWPLYLQM